METNSLFGDFRPYREAEENFGTGETQNSRYRNLRPRVLFLYVNDNDPLWNWIFLGLCVFGIAFDALFLYTPVIDDDKKSLGLDKKLGIVVIVLRSFFDVFHLLYIVLELRPHSFAPCFIYQRGNSTEYPQGTARKYLMLPVDLLSILPLPQVVILAVIRGSKLPNVMNLLKVFVIVQYVPRINRMYHFFTKARSMSAKLAETTWLKALFNLLLYMLASHFQGFNFQAHGSGVSGVCSILCYSWWLLVQIAVTSKPSANANPVHQV